MRRSMTVAALALAIAGCELDEVAVVSVEDVVIAEVYVSLAADPLDNEVTAFLHRTVGSGFPGVDPFDQARVTVRRPDGLTVVLGPRNLEECVLEVGPNQSGGCFRADGASATLLRSGDVLELEIRLQDGRGLMGATRIPADFGIIGDPSVCVLQPDTQWEVQWSSADGAWAYVNETSLRGLPDALAPEGIVVEEDPLYLLGLSITDQDTTIVFPTEFGLFDRFDLDQDLAVRLQRGIPDNTSAEVSISAVDRNYVNWARGGNFNPSGQVRVPSLSGDGTGVFAAAVTRRFTVLSTVASPGVDPCPSGGE